MPTAIETQFSVADLPLPQSRPPEHERSPISLLVAPVESSQPPSTGKEYWVEAFEEIEAVAHYRDAWQDLATQAAEPNPFYEPWMFLPAWNAFGHEAPGTRFLLVWQRDSHFNRSATLVGFVPLTPRRGFGGLPVRLWRVWQHAFCYLCTPLVRRGRERDALAAVLDWLAEGRKGLLELHHVDAEGPLARALIDVTDQRKASAFVVERYNRAMLHRGKNFEEYIHASMSNHGRKELRRQQRRLAAMGTLETRLLSGSPLAAKGNAACLDPWIRQFLEIEASGWKGREKTALGSQPVTTAYFETICRAALERNQLSMVGLYLNGRPLAMCCNFHSGEGSFAFKISFDEAYAKYSPGVLLEIENTRLVHELPGVRWMDSCAVSDHSMINRLWGERRTIRKVLVSPGRWMNNLAVDVLAALAGVRRVFRRFLKPFAP